MQVTIFKTPVFEQILRGLSIIGLAMTGWRVVGEAPSEKKCVIVAAPHTSNWDFPLLIAMACVLRFEIYWMGKDSLFFWPAGYVMKWLGGIPINRRSANDMVQVTVDAFNEREALKVVIPPEGTRSRVKDWKTGFYHIAVGAKVPIGLSFLDFGKKVGGFLGTYYPTGDADRDIAEIRQKYEGIRGKKDL